MCIATAVQKQPDEASTGGFGKHDDDSALVSGKPTDAFGDRLPRRVLRVPRGRVPCAHDRKVSGIASPKQNVELRYQRVAREVEGE